MTNHQREDLTRTLFDAICDRRFPKAVALDLPVIEILEDEARCYADAVLALPHTEQRLKALARRNEFWAEMMKPLMPREGTKNSERLLTVIANKIQVSPDVVYRVPNPELEEFMAAIVEEGREERTSSAATAKRLSKLLHELGLI